MMFKRKAIFRLANQVRQDRPASPVSDEPCRFIEKTISNLKNAICLLAEVTILTLFMFQNSYTQVLNEGFFRRDVIVLYDLTGSVYQTDMRPRINQYLKQILFKFQIDVAADSKIDKNNFSKFDINLPLLGDNDILHILPNGINGQNIADIDEKSGSNAEFTVSLANTLFSKSREYKLVEPASLYLDSLVSYKRYDYPMLRYLLPMALSKLSDYEIKSESHLVVMVTDYVAGGGSIGIEDREAIRMHAKTRVEYLENTVLNEFNDLYDEGNILFQAILNRGIDKPVMIRIFRLEPINLPRIEFSEDESYQFKEKGKNIILDPVTLKCKVSKGDISGFDVFLSNINIISRKTKTLTKFEFNIPRLKDEIKTPEIVLPKKEFHGESSVGIRGDFAILYNKNSLWKGRLYSTISTSSRDAFIVWKGLNWWIWGPVLTILVLTIGFFVWLYKYRPTFEISIHYDRNTPDFITVGGDIKYPVYAVSSAATGDVSYTIPIRIKHTGKFKHLELSAYISETQIPEQFSEFWKHGIYLNTPEKESKQASGIHPESPIHMKLNRGETQTIGVILMPQAVNAPEKFPSRLEECIQITFTFQSSDMRTDKKTVIFGLCPDLGDQWVGFDPGTTGTCCSLWNHEKDEPDLLLLEDGQNIMPTMVYFSAEDNVVLVGKGAEDQIRAKPQQGFFSIKKLIGYENKRTITHNRKQESFTGEDILSKIVRDVNKKLKPHLDGGSLSRMVVAVPNYFTPIKIDRLKDCIVRSLKDSPESNNNHRLLFKDSVRHLYEAEASVLYYRMKYDEFNTGRPKRIATHENEDILVFDFGGGTLNASIVSLIQEDPTDGKMHLDIKARIGYSIGGDTIDRIVAMLIWRMPEFDEFRKKYSNKFENNTPFATNIDNMQGEIKEDRTGFNYALKLIAREIKESLGSKTPADEFEYSIRLVKPFPLNTTLKINKRKFTEDIFLFQDNDINLKSLIEQAVREVIEIFGHTGDGELETVILSGRSVQLRGVEDLVMNTLKAQGQKPFKIKYVGEQTKTCVVSGAAFYGNHGSYIELTRGCSLASFGIRVPQFNNPSYNKYVELVRLKEPFSNNKIEKQIPNERDKQIDIRGCGQRIHFMQINGADAENAINKKLSYKTALLAKVNNVSGSTLDDVKFTLKDDDTFSFELSNSYFQYKSNDRRIESIDLFEDNHPSNLWPFDESAFR